jgi:hypothetical protein
VSIRSAARPRQVLLATLGTKSDQLRRIMVPVSRRLRRSLDTVGLYALHSACLLARRLALWSCTLTAVEIANTLYRWLSRMLGVAAAYNGCSCHR